MVVPRPPSAPSYPPPSSYCPPHTPFKLIDPRPSTLHNLPRFSTSRNVYSIPCNANFCFSHNARRIHPQVNGVHNSKSIRRAAAGSHRQGHAGSFLIDSLVIQVITLPVSPPIPHLLCLCLSCFAGAILSLFLVGIVSVEGLGQAGGEEKALTGQRLHNGQSRYPTYM